MLLEKKLFCLPFYEKVIFSPDVQKVPVLVDVVQTISDEIVISERRVVICRCKVAELFHMEQLADTVEEFVNAVEIFLEKVSFYGGSL